MKSLNPTPFGNKTAETKADEIIKKAGRKYYNYKSVEEAIKSYEERANKGSGFSKQFANLVIFHLKQKISIFESN